MDEFLACHISGVGQALRVTDLKAHEQLNALFKCSLTCLSVDLSLSPAKLLRQPGVACIRFENQTHRYFHGIVSEFISGSTFSIGQKQYRHYQLTLSPQVYLLKQSINKRVFQEQTAIEIIESLLTEFGYHDWDSKLHKPLATRSYCVQYQESTWQFIQRLLSEEALYYFFHCNADKHCLFITDDITADSVHTPTLQYSKQVSHWSHHYLISSSDGVTHKHYCRGQSDDGLLCAGTSFQLSDHSCAEENTAYLCKTVKHQAHNPCYHQHQAPASPSYHNHFECFPAQADTFLQQQIKPRLSGLHPAVVTGPVGEKIYTNPQGCIKIQFLWDQYGTHDEYSSCWIPLCHAWLDSHSGTYFIPRVGQKVQISFIDGDPDQPMIIGCSQNDHHHPPYPLPEAKTKAVIRTQSLEKSNEYNELSFDDKHQQEKITLHAQRDFTTDVKQDITTIVGNNAITHITGSQTTTIEQGNQTTQLNTGSVKINAQKITLAVGVNRIIIDPSSIKLLGNVVY